MRQVTLTILASFMVCSELSLAQHLPEYSSYVDAADVVLQPRDELQYTDVDVYERVHEIDLDACRAGGISRDDKALNWKEGQQTYFCQVSLSLPLPQDFQKVRRVISAPYASTAAREHIPELGQSFYFGRYAREVSLPHGLYYPAKKILNSVSDPRGLNEILESNPVLEEAGLGIIADLNSYQITTSAESHEAASQILHQFARKIRANNIEIKLGVGIFSDKDDERPSQYEGIDRVGRLVRVVRYFQMKPGDFLATKGIVKDGFSYFRLSDYGYSNWFRFQFAWNEALIPDYALTPQHDRSLDPRQQSITFSHGYNPSKTHAIVGCYAQSSSWDGFGGLIKLFAQSASSEVLAELGLPKDERSVAEIVDECHVEFAKALNRMSFPFYGVARDL